MSWVSQSLSVLHTSLALHTSFSACLPPPETGSPGEKAPCLSYFQIPIAIRHKASMEQTSPGIY